MKWTNKKPTKEGFYLYVDQQNTDGKPIVLEVTDITEMGCQPKAAKDIKWHKELAVTLESAQSVNEYCNPIKFGCFSYQTLSLIFSIVSLGLKR